MYFRTGFIAALAALLILPTAALAQGTSAEGEEDATSERREAPSAADDPYAATGPFETGEVESLLLGSIVQNNAVDARIHFPRGEGPFPLIVFSHGLGGSKDVFTEVTSHWASHGYIIVQPTHNDEGVSFSGGGMNPPENKVRERLENVVTVLDSVVRMERSVPGLEGRIDTNRIAVAGHSYGSFITMLAGGLTVDFDGEGNISLEDERVQCILPISPSGRGDYGMNDDSFNMLELPAMFFTGTQDQRSGRPEDWRMEPYHLSPRGGKFLVIIEGARHGDFGGDTDSTAPLYVKAASTAFWDWCLKSSEAGLTYLESENGFRGFAGDQATIETK